MTSHAQIFGALGAAAAALGVAAGAFGAHALARRLEPRMLDIFETAARYQLYHALALLAVAWLASRHPSGLTHAAGWLFAAGIAIFSGSLYALALTGVRWLGAITPIGGTALIAGWILLAVAFTRVPLSAP